MKAEASFLGIAILCCVLAAAVKDCKAAHAGEVPSCHNRPCNTSTHYCCGYEKCCKLEKQVSS